VIVSQNNADAAEKVLASKGETVYQIGRIRKQKTGEAATIVV
jgi:phosphoribosylaminoimidazole (AIR) synthetase